MRKFNERGQNKIEAENRRYFKALEELALKYVKEREDLAKEHRNIQIGIMKEVAYWDEE